MLWFPFICLAAGAAIGLNKAAARVIRCVDPVITMGLVILMVTLGLKIGSKEALFQKLGLLLGQCLVIAVLAIAGSVLFTVLLEKTLLPLREIRAEFARNQLAAGQDQSAEQQGAGQASAALLWIMPVSFVTGVAGGCWVMPAAFEPLLDYALSFALAVLYVGIGIVFGKNKGVFHYLKLLSWRITLISPAIILGSLLGGAFAGLLLGLSPQVTVLAAAGMSYYSITGAILTQTYGIEVGAYGFLVNVAREFLTVLFVPVLSRISLGSPIAAGAAGDMDTMLVPITRLIGMELGLVTLITGTILTFAVPLLLSLLMSIG